MTLPTFDPGFTTARMAGVFAAPRRIAAMLEVERALVLAQAAAGVVPQDAAKAIASACASLEIDAEDLLGRGWDVGTVVLPLVDALRAAVDADAGPWVHFGATTQDVVDTALMLQAREGLDALSSDLGRVVARCRMLASLHRATPAEGRTFLQRAAVTTFGHRAATWWLAADDAGHRIAAARAALPAQIGGPVGHLAALGSRADAVRSAFAGSLSLRLPPIAWHADRQPVRDLAWALDAAAAACAKIAADVALLAQTEIGEVHVRAGRSSSMAGKANPLDAMRALAAVEAAAGVISVVTRGSPQALERGLGAWHAEAFAVPLAFHATAAAVEATARCTESLEPDAERMAAHVSESARAEVAAIAAEVDRLLGRKP